MIKAYLKFLLKSKNEHSLHSPFVYDLYTNVIQKKETKPAYSAIEKYRQEQLKNTQTIEIKDFGAGSRHNKSNIRKIGEIAKNAEKNPKFGQLLYRLIAFLKPKTAIDLGTSLGITTLYQSIAMPANTEIFTFEGCPETAEIAKSYFKMADAANIQTIVGNIDETLPAKLAEINQIDFAFFDANHRYEPTIRYFEACLAKAHEQTVFVFDDIHWSAEMEKAWYEIKAHPKVMISIDLFYIGLIFFRSNQPKQDFTLRF